jgi:translation initiation factor IF-3
MIKIQKIFKCIYPIYFKQPKKIFFNQNSIKNFRLLSSSKISNFNFTLSLYNNKSPNQQGQQQQNRKPRDEEIKSQYIKYVNLEGQLQGKYPLQKILSSFDRKKYWLVQVSPVNAALSSKNSSQQKEKEEIPICKLVSKQELYKQSKQKQQTTPHILKKELKLTWKVSPNDLAHKLSRSKEWLEKGYQLRVVISNKTKKEDNKDKTILDKIFKELSEFAKDIKEPKWVDGSVTIEIQGKINIHKDFPTDIDSDAGDVGDSAIDTNNFTLEKVKEK